MNVQVHVVGQSNGRIDFAHHARQSGPAFVGVSRVFGGEQRQSKFDVADLHTPCIRVDDGLAILLNFIGTEAHKRIQTAAANADELGFDQTAIGQRDILHPSLKAQ